MPPIRSLCLFLLFALAADGVAQVLPVEELGPIHARPVEGSTPGELRSLLNEFFIYDYLPQELPLEDDFSTDRTRHLDAQGGQAGVTLTATYYQLEVGGVSTADMAYMMDTTFLLLYDTAQVDTMELTITPLPSVSITMYDLDVYPPTTTVVEGWPPFDLVDTVGDPTMDTAFYVPVDLIQDSLFVYTVAADTRTYDQNGTLQPLILWEDDYAYVNRTYPVDPPTIGVATFDGLDRTGFPYDVTVLLPYGECDRLTSVPIDLQYPAGDSVYVSFLYQPQGLSGDDIVQVQDSLVLELYAPVDEEWVQVWQADYTALQPFKQVMVPITETRFLQPDFQMRWRNYGTRSGALDQWHLDYVRLGRNRSFDDTVLVDVAFVMPESTVLQTYTSVPFNKFSASPASFMAQSVELTMKNLDIDDKFITWGYSSGIDGSAPVETCGNYGNNISNNAETTFQTTHPVNTSPCDFVYDPALSTDAAFWRTNFWLNTTPNNIPYNDTLSFLQEISNYYAYDDGSAEAGYSLNTQGAKVAVRFDTQGGDSLRAVRMYFDPIFSENDPTDGSFLITVWTGLNPEVVQFQNFSFSEPTYRLDGPNKFVEFQLDSTIYVQGTFYVGWVQTNAIKMNVGFDKNRNNADRIFYKVSGPFANTSFQGSLMLRPVMVSAVDPWASVPEVVATDVLVLYPNPANEEVFIRFEGADQPAAVELYDAMGRVVERNAFRTNTPMSVSGMAPGVYLVRVLDEGGMLLGQERMIIQR